MANTRVVLVTGASAGFGKATALLLAARGDRVYGAFRGSGAGFQATARTIVEEADARGVRIETVPLDVCDDASVAQCVDSVLEGAERIDAVVNNAGFGVHGPWETISVPQFHAQLETNLVGVFRVCRAVAPAMRRQGAGWIVNVSSDAALRTAFWEAAYSASKYALEGMSLGMRLESQQFGIRVAMVNPGGSSQATKRR